MTERRNDRRAWCAIHDIETALRLLAQAIEELGPEYEEYQMPEYIALRSEVNLLIQRTVDRDVIADALDNAVRTYPNGVQYSHVMDEDLNV